MLLLHGNPAWSFLYRKIIAGLSGEFRCIAPDYPGYGMSGAEPRVRPFSAVLGGPLRAAGLYGGRSAASCRALDRASGQPDKGMKPAVGDVLEALNLLETGPLVHGDRPAVERSHGEGIALCPERR